MNKILLILILSFSFNTYAEDVPKFLKDAEITVKLKNGKEYKFSSNEYAVVSRKSSLKDKLEEKEVNEQHLVHILHVLHAEVVKREPKKNRARLIGGYGPTGLKTERQGSSFKVTNSSGAVGGVGYDRMLDDKWSVNSQAVTNGTYMLGVGYDW